MESTSTQTLLGSLNPQQRTAVQHGTDPLLIIAGAGTGKTTTLAARVAWQIAQGIDPQRILLLTFSRRAAAEMLRRVERLVQELESTPTTAVGGSGSGVWGGTFHAVATRILRQFGKPLGLPPGFTIMDRSDSEDLLNVVRADLNLAKLNKRFPLKGTCLEIYSRCVNTQLDLASVLKRHFPWCEEHAVPLRELFAAYTDRKQQRHILDYDDLLLFWHSLLADEGTAQFLQQKWDRIFVDEFQDTNVVQAEILQRLAPAGRGVTVVGDDAQSIYSFRAAEVRNILDFPQQYPGTVVCPLEQNFRSTQPILDTTNAIIAEAGEGYRKSLWSDRHGGDRPWLVSCEDDHDQAEFIIERLLSARERGVPLQAQAVLFRASHHSAELEVQLQRANIPFVKFGGLKFIEAAHIKDVLGFLRLAENPADLMSGLRILQLLPGIGPKKARTLLEVLAAAEGDLAVWDNQKLPPATQDQWLAFLALMRQLTRTARELESLTAQLSAINAFYAPILKETYDHWKPRLRDLESLESLAARYQSRQEFLADLTLDPPSSTQDLAAEPFLDEDFVILSTIHSAKGLEWDSVFVIHAADGNIPSDLATGSEEEIDEERRLFYVATTRAKNQLYVCCPRRYYYPPRSQSDAHTMAQITRFITRSVASTMQKHLAGPQIPAPGTEGPAAADRTESIRSRIKSMWE